ERVTHVEAGRAELELRMVVGGCAAGAVLEVRPADEAARPRVARVAVRVRALEQQPVHETPIHARGHAVVPGACDVRARADTSPARIGQRGARHDLPVTIAGVELYGHLVRVAVEGQVVAARSD